MVTLVSDATGPAKQGIQTNDMNNRKHSSKAVESSARTQLDMMKLYR